MDSQIAFEDKNLGRIRQVRNERGELELALVFNDSKSAAFFVKLSGEAMLDAGNVLMRLDHFKAEYFPRITRIYSSEEAYEREGVGGRDTNNG